MDINILRGSTKITSSQNTIIKQTAALKQKKAREEEKLFLIEGLRFVEEAFKSNADIEKIFVTKEFIEGPNNAGFMENISMAFKSNKGDEIRHKPEVYVVAENVFARMSDTETPQGIMAVVRMRNENADKVFAEKGGIFLILESIQDPGNMGTIIRTGDAAGVSGIFISKGCVDIYNPKVLRSTMGSIFHVPCIKCDDIISTISALKTSGIKVIAAHLKGEKSYFEVNMKDGAAIIIGNEANGISNSVAEAADMLVKIPMPGKAESLNASVAAALMVYEAVRQQLS